jgi:acid phosphatase (class A)
VRTCRRPDARQGPDADADAGVRDTALVREAIPKNIPMRPKLRLVPALLIAAGCAQKAAPAISDGPQPQRRLSAGYIGGQPLPDAELLLPPPPAAGTAAMARDEEAARDAIAQRGTPRRNLAIADADLRLGHTAASLSCAAGFPISKETTPLLYRLLTRAGSDFGGASAAIKRRYMRPRPFIVNNEPNCTPNLDKVPRNDGSCPSGHRAMGYGTSLILAELVPDRAARILAYGNSRRICNAHWLSDTEEGRVIATATVMRLNADPAFRQDLEAARQEIDRLRPTAMAPDQQCAAEARALPANR